MAVIGGRAPARTDALARITVAIGALETGSGRLSLSYCSGVLISPDEVLTAGHCVADGPIKAVVLAPIGRGGALRVFPVESLSRRGYRIDALDGGTVTSLAQLTYDTALLRLASRVPGARRLAIASSARETPQRLRLDGRGLSGRALGTLRSAPLVPIARSRSGLIVARSLGAQVCKGDSGSPVVADVNGAPLLYGVASAVLTRNGRCGNVVVIAPARPAQF
jgi:secreted trypsin-like serine protease